MNNISIKNVRMALSNMGNLYVNTLSDEELNSAILQDDLGLQEHELPELIKNLENFGRFFILEPAKSFLRDSSTVTVRRFKRVCNKYISEFQTS
jgi:hypothetical protein